MLDYLENLRKKPEAERRKSVLYLSIWITVIITLVWGVVTYMKIDNTDFAVKEPAPKDIPSLKDSFSSFFDSLGNIFERTQTKETSTQEEITIEEDIGVSGVGDAAVDTQ